MPPEIPDKVYFKIGEAAQIVGVEPYVLRYWETEFPQVRPDRAVSKQRLYTRRDVELLLEIKRLLYEEEYTIAGAKKKIAGRKKPPATGPLKPEHEILVQVKEGLMTIKRLLEHF